MLFAAGIRELVGGQTQFPLHSDTVSWGLIILSLVVFLVSLLGCVSALSLSKRIAYTVSSLSSQYWAVTIKECQANDNRTLFDERRFSLRAAHVARNLIKLSASAGV